MTITEDAAPPGAGGPRWRRTVRRGAAWGAARRNGIAVGLLSAVSAAVYSVLGLVQLHTFRATSFDLVIFDQAIRGYSRFGWPLVPVKGMNVDRGMDYLQLADHFSPLLSTLAPLYWLHDGPETLIVAQSVLLAAAVPFVWLYTRRTLGVAPSHLVALAYTLAWPVTQAADFDFHEVAFVPLLTAVMIERHQAGRHLPSYLAMAGLLLVKEDMGLLVIGFGLYLFLTGERQAGVSFGLIGAGWTALVREVLIPMAGGDTGDYWAYGHLGDGVGEMALSILRDPLGAVHLIVGEEAKVDTLLLLAWPTLMLCLLSPLTLAAVPLLLERMLADRALWWSADFHYNAFVVVVVFCAGVDGLARLLRWTGRRDDRALMLSWSVGVCAVALTLLPRFALDQLVHGAFYQRDAHARAAADAVALVPDGVVVEAANSLGPALTARTTVLLWDQKARGAPWVVADVSRGEFPMGDADAQRRRVDELLASGYRKVFDREGIVVLNHP